MPEERNEGLAGLESIRRELALLCRSRRTRTSEFSKARPCRWQPTQVNDPETGDPFTDDSAWQFIADALDNGHPLLETTLRKPPGKRGYVMVIPLGSKIELYVKLQLGSGCVFGRSFHESNGKVNSGEEDA